VSLLGEFGLTLQALSEQRNNERNIVMKRVMLDVYAKSGAGNVLRSSVYSDKDKNTKVVASPALTILGESTPEAFYSALSTTMLLDGLVPRFLIVEYTGPRPPKNRNAFAPPPESLVRRVADLATTVLQMAANHTTFDVPLDPEASALLDAYDKECDNKINSNPDPSVREVWNRAHLKALKLAALVAVGRDMHTPVIGAADARWAMELVHADATHMEGRFAKGDIGDGESVLFASVRRLVNEYSQRKWKDVKGYTVVSEAMHRDGIVPQSYLAQRTATLAAFRNHRLGATGALKLVLSTLVEQGELAEIPSKTMRERYKKNARAFTKNEL
jgi:hypothetical protein